MSDALGIHGIEKRFGSTPVLNGVHLDVAAGSLSAVLGPSGCGKTTLLRIIAGFETADAGRVTVGDRDITTLATERRNVGVVPQEGALFPHLDVAKNVGFGLRRLDRDDRARRVAECLDLVGLNGYERVRPETLSGGQQQRVALARALAPAPAVLLLDEPFAALDANLRATVRAELAEAVRASGTTTVLVTHDRDEALSLVDHVAVMLNGKIVQSGSPEALYRRPVSAGVATFVGEACLIPATSRDGRAESALGAVECHGAEGAVLLVIRPEQVVLGPHGLPAIVRAVSYFGHDCLVDLTVAGIEGLSARVTGHHVPDVGASVRISLDGVVPTVPSA